MGHERDAGRRMAFRGDRPVRPSAAPRRRPDSFHLVRDLRLPELLVDPSQRRDVEAGVLRDHGAGDPLASAARARARGIAEHPLPDVRVHRDERTRRTVDVLGSAAFTMGNDIFLGSAAESGRGDWVLGHEVAHALQQEIGTRRPDRAGDETIEREADSFADAFVTHGDAPDVPRLSPGEHAIAQKVIWKYMQNLPGGLLLIIDVDDGDFVGGCVRQIVPHAGIKLIQKTPHVQLFNLHVGFLTDPAGQFCIFFYESVSGICELNCFASRQALEESWDEVMEWLRDLLMRLLQALAILALLVAAAVLVYLIAVAIMDALLVLLAA